MAINLYEIMPPASKNISDIADIDHWSLSLNLEKFDLSTRISKCVIFQDDERQQGMLGEVLRGKGYSQVNESTSPPPMSAVRPLPPINVDTLELSSPPKVGENKNNGSILFLL